MHNSLKTLCIASRTVARDNCFLCAIFTRLPREIDVRVTRSLLRTLPKDRIDSGLSAVYSYPLLFPNRNHGWQRQDFSKCCGNCQTEGRRTNISAHVKKTSLSLRCQEPLMALPL